jgi:hypothetical protein
MTEEKYGIKIKEAWADCKYYFIPKFEVRDRKVEVSSLRYEPHISWMPIAAV